MATAGCAGLILAGKGYWQGWALGLAVQPVWAVFAIVTEGYGLLITVFMYGTVYAKNLLKWRKNQSKKKDAIFYAVRDGLLSSNEVRDGLTSSDDRTSIKFTPVIFGGNYDQGYQYCLRNDIDPRDVVIVTSYRQLEGLRFRGRDVTRVGTWHKHRDLQHIEDIIARNTVLYKE